MATLVSSWYKNVESMPEEYIFPSDKRPGKIITNTQNNPVMDLEALDHNRTSIIQHIMKASQEFGFFQVINHGISEGLINETTYLYQEFFGMPADEKAKYYSVDPNSRCRLYTSTYNYDSEDKHFWRDNLTHPCHPLEEYMPFWPEKPSRYREIVGNYTGEVRKVVMKILELICEGLELEKGYFDKELSQVNLISVNYYPPCPDPTSALGMHNHRDPNLITCLHQGNVKGLQVLKDGQWIWAEPLPNAFVLIIGCQLQIISNEKLKSAEHRVVTNSEEIRTSLGIFILPTADIYIEPAKELINPSNPPRYRGYTYKEYLSTYGAKNGDSEAVLESFMLKSD